MDAAEPSKRTVVSTIRELKAQEEARRADAQTWQRVSSPDLGSEIPQDDGRPETPLETLVGLKTFVPKENLASYLNFVSYLSRREEEDVFVRLVQFLAIHTKLGQQLPSDIYKAGDEVVKDIRQAMAYDISSWREEHESLNRIKHEFQGSISSMLKEHRDAHQKHLTVIMDAVIKTVNGLEENQRLLSRELESLVHFPNSAVHSKRKGSSRSERPLWGKFLFYFGILILGSGIACLFYWLVTFFQ